MVKVQWHFPSKERWAKRPFSGFWKDGLLDELQVRMSRSCRILLFLPHKYQVSLIYLIQFDFSYSFHANPSWSRSFSHQPEILRYMERVADRFDVTRHIEFGKRVEKAEWDEKEHVWNVALGDSEVGIYTPLFSLSLPFSLHSSLEFGKRVNMVKATNLGSHWVANDILTPSRLGVQ